MRQAARVDGNQGRIVEALRALPGCSVQSIAVVGKGVPDLIIGIRGRNFLLEIKDPTQPVRGRRLTPAESIWHRSWYGQVALVESLSDALMVLGSVHGCERCVEAVSKQGAW